MLYAQSSAALNQRQTAAIGQTREKSRIEFPQDGISFYCFKDSPRRHRHVG